MLAVFGPLLLQDIFPNSLSDLPIEFHEDRIDGPCDLFAGLFDEATISPSNWSVLGGCPMTGRVSFGDFFDFAMLSYRGGRRAWICQAVERPEDGEKNGWIFIRRLEPAITTTLGGVSAGII